MKNKVPLIKSLSLFLGITGGCLGMIQLFFGLVVNPNFMMVVLGYLFLFIGIVGFIIFNTIDFMGDGR